MLCDDRKQRVAVNILNTQSWTADKRWSSAACGLGMGLKTPHLKKKKLLMKILNKQADVAIHPRPTWFESWIRH